MDTLERVALLIGFGVIAGLAKYLQPTNRFDHQRLKMYSVEALKKFADEHPNETFYGFSIDATMLCLNSEESFAKTVGHFAPMEPSDLRELRFNTGDWEYQGFADLLSSGGFDEKAYEDHYGLDPQKQKGSAYSKAMDRLIDDLKACGAFDALKKAPDFFASRVEHD